MKRHKGFLLSGPVKHIEIFGHRGAPTEAPENTMSSFQRAFEAGAGAVELDLRRTLDGRVVVFHDKKLDRTTNGRGRVDSLSEDELLELDAGAWFGPKFAGEKIPVLDEVLKWAAETGVRLDLELKDDEIEEFVVRRIKAHEIEDSVVLSSWSVKNLLAARGYDPKVRIAPILVAGLHLRKHVEEIKPEFVLLWSGPALTAGIVEKAEKLGVPVVAWLVNSEPLFKKVKGRGVAGVITDETALICGAAERKS